MIDDLSNIPSSVYRLQLNEKFPIKKAIAFIPYLHQLGIEGVYLSPIFAFSDSSYAITDPNRLDPRIGTEKDFELLCKDLQKYNMKQILDIVPNHMSLKNNPWFFDLLKKGKCSKYASFFDIRWNEGRGKVLLPILKETYNKILEAGEIKLIEKEGEVLIQYDGFFFPLRKGTLNLPSQGRHLSCGNQRGFQLGVSDLHELLERQLYQLTHWNLAIDKINYRRFFNINDLIAIHIENKDVFKTYHKWILTLLATKKIQGLRIDHIDGLYNPTQYLRRLRGKAPLIWVEKILVPDEKLPEKWPIDGTVGYEFLHILSNLFVCKENEEAFTTIYEWFIEEKIEFFETAYQRKKVFVEKQMYSAIACLGNLFQKLSHKTRVSQEFTKRHFIKACTEIIACFPVYRTYVDSPNIQKQDEELIHRAIGRAKQKTSTLNADIFDTIKSLLLFEKKGKDSREFIFRFQQLTATAMAKGLEDSAFYIYNRLISLNEVGGDPTKFGSSAKEFHTYNRYKLSTYPLGALSSSTHDTKFSEDARLRLHALSELPSAWKSFLLSVKKSGSSIDRNTEYYLYQMVLALGPATRNRVWSCLQKAIREMGVYTSWAFPNKEYENRVKTYLYSFLDSKKISSLQNKVDRLGLQNSLSALVLKLGSCGIFDLYQGNEHILYQLVDPDNRKYIPKKTRKKDLKASITSIGLTFRKEHKDLFLKGEYIPLKTSDHVIAFMRIFEHEIALVVVKRCFSKTSSKPGIKLPLDLPYLENVFTGEAFCANNPFLTYPFGIFYGITKEQCKR